MKRSVSPGVLIGGIFVVVALIFGVLIGAGFMNRVPAPASTQAPNPALSAANPPPIVGPPLALANLVHLSSETFFFIDSINEVALQTPPPMPIRIKGDAPITLTGWAVDDTAGNVAGGVFASVDDAMAFPADYGIDRPDVAAALKNPVAQKSGFSVTIPPNALAIGRHTLTIKIVTTDRKSYYAPAQKIDIEIV